MYSTALSRLSMFSYSVIIYDTIATPEFWLLS